MQIKNLIHKFRHNYLLASSSTTLFIQLMAMLLGFFSSWLVSRWLGASGWGLFSYIFSWITILSGLTLLGWDMLLLKQTPVLLQKSKQNTLYTILFYAIWICLIAGIVCIFLVQTILSATWFIELLPPKALLSNYNNRQLFILATFIIPIIGFIKLYEALLRGFKKITLSQLPIFSVRPVVFLSMITYLYFSTEALSINQLIITNLVAFLTAFIVSIGLLPAIRHQMIVQFSWQLFNVEKIKRYVQPAAVFWGISVVSLINVKTDIIMLGFFADEASVGVYDIAAKLSEILKILLVVVNLSLSPLIAQWHIQNKKQQLQQTITRSIRIVFWVSLPLAIIYVLFGTNILQTWGSEFTAAYPCLLILGAAQLVNIGTGSVANILNMTGLEQWVFRAGILSTLLNILLNLLLVPQIGITGAAIATATSVITWNFILWYVVWTKLKVDASILGVHKHTIVKNK